MKTLSEHKIISIDESEKILSKWRDTNESIVFTNGCFDIVHLGHIDYLEKAAQLGSKLVLGLNSDTSVKRLKGPERPINNELSRSRMLAALGFVDLVVIFDEDTPETLIHLIKPNVLVKGDDYSFETIVGAEFVASYGGEVKTVSLVKGFSTTSLIEKIKHL